MCAHLHKHFRETRPPLCLAHMPQGGVAQAKFAVGGRVKTFERSKQDAQSYFASRRNENQNCSHNQLDT